MGGPPLPEPGSPGAILFVTATSPLDAGSREASSQLEREVRTHVERSYAQQGMARAEYELEIF